MDRELMIKDLAAMIGTTEDTVINWELRDVKPTLKRHRKGLMEFLGPEVYDGRIPITWPLVAVPSIPKSSQAVIPTEVPHRGGGDDDGTEPARPATGVA